MYFPETFRVAPAEAGLPEAEEVTLKTSDGEQVIAWHVPPKEGRPVALYFHGNGGSLRYRIDRFRALTALGDGLVALSYRGYGGSSGKPTESGLIEDARAAYDFATARYPAERIILWANRSAPGSRLRSPPSGRSLVSCWRRRSRRPWTLPPVPILSCRCDG
jgi:pimeloyl-ACP methyl ester carboxylesterase